MTEPREDELLRLRRELAEAEAIIAALRVENASLGGIVSLRSAAPGTTALRGAASDTAALRGAAPFRGAPALPSAAPLACAVPGAEGAALRGAAYRSLDPCVETEEALSEALATIADLRIENAILRSRSAARVPWRAAAIGLAALAGTLGLMGFFWLVSRSAGLLLFAAVMVAIGLAMVHLIGGIPPRDGGSPPGPPLIPGG